MRESFPPAEGDHSYTRYDAWRVAFDLLFFVLINTVAMNLVLGIIVDTFSQLRAERLRRIKAIKKACILCGLESTSPLPNIGAQPNIGAHCALPHAAPRVALCTLCCVEHSFLKANPDRVLIGGLVPMTSPGHQFEHVPGGFYKHFQQDHHMWNYVYVDFDLDKRHNRPCLPALHTGAGVCGVRCALLASRPCRGLICALCILLPPTTTCQVIFTCISRS